MERRPYATIVLDTDSHQQLDHFVCVAENGMVEHHFQVGKHYRITHQKPVEYENIRGRIPSTVFFVWEVQGKMIDFDTLTGAVLSISLTNQADAERHQIRRKQFWFVVYPGDQVTEIK